MSTQSKTLETPKVYSLSPRERVGVRGFTLTELLVVIAIIAVLASLITAAAIRGLHSARRSRISLEIKNISASIEEFKNEYGAYPPSLVNDGTPAIQNQVQGDLLRMFKKAFPRMDPREEIVLKALSGAKQVALQNSLGVQVSGNDPPLPFGMNAEEAVFFWLGGFSSDEQFPITGDRGPSFLTTGPGEILENRTFRYQFDRTRLGPRAQNGAFDSNSGRSITYTINRGNGPETRQINLWEYNPGSSQRPLAYFDTSRYKPHQYDPPIEIAQDEDNAHLVYAFKQLREGAVPTSSTASASQYVVFVNQNKFQLLHSGIDETWGDFSAMHVQSNSTLNGLILYPTGPFIGDIADTLTNFTDSSIADATTK